MVARNFRAALVLLAAGAWAVPASAEVFQTDAAMTPLPQPVGMNEFNLATESWAYKRSTDVNRDAMGMNVTGMNATLSAPGTRFIGAIPRSDGRMRTRAPGQAVDEGRIRGAAAVDRGAWGGLILSLSIHARETVDGTARAAPRQGVRTEAGRTRGRGETFILIHT